MRVQCRDPGPRGSPQPPWGRPSGRGLAVPLLPGQLCRALRQPSGGGAEGWARGPGFDSGELPARSLPRPLLSLLFAPPGPGHFCPSLLSVFLFPTFHVTSPSSLCTLPSSYPSYSPPLVFFSATCPHTLPRPFPFLPLLSICFLLSLPQPRAASPFCPLVSVTIGWLACKYISELYSASPHLLPAPPPISF